MQKALQIKLAINYMARKNKPSLPNKFFFLMMIMLLVSPFLLAGDPLYQPESETSPLLKKRIQTWIQALAKENETQAQQNLRRIGMPAMPQLLEALKGKNVLVQRRAIEIIADIQVTPAVKLLIEMVQNESLEPRVREAAATALGRCPSDAVLPILSKCSLHHDARIYRSAGNALIRNPSKANIPYLIPLLKHWDSDLQTKAYICLKQLTKQNLPCDAEIWRKWWNDYQDIWEESESIY